ncbi:MULTISPECIES: DUF4956 domain-containing protein [Romboutsia]|uniref:DUF4956 domain-containing protein n=1 Tax=Romboutsia TaxID=1501226 RepID=UPI0018AC2BBF|nr:MULTISPECIES: DUF4956 domain-containing protein [Romboutsia]MCH1960613.1 DUF4956 domain-containing protein [Romboutsia hominis]MCH1968955.1 DUF4956 domain-containing protein [Romboutsia hominis]
MKETLLKYLQENNGVVPIEQVGMNFLVAIILSIVIYLSYRYSHSRAVYSARFNVSLVMLTIITTMVMGVIGNNIALSLGMVGALSIVRFRTAIKDPRDTVYIFWCIVVGICCGVSEYVIPSMGSGIIFLFLLIFGYVKSNDRFLLIIHAKNDAEEDIEKKVLIAYDGKANMRVKNTTSSRIEYIYELSQKLIEISNKKGINITKGLYEIDGVDAVNLVCQNEDINR